MERILSEKFENDLLNGCLKGLREHILADNTLMLAVRDGYVNVYYRGGNILKLSEKGDGYDASFDENYTKGQSLQLPNSPMRVASETDIQQWVESFPVRKQIMDFWFAKNPKMEREFQQLVARENNTSPISNETEYFITDIELAIPGARFDMLAFKWLSTERKADKVRLALIEMKYGDGALTGTSGIVAHLTQLGNFLSDSESRKTLREMATKQINQLNRLGLIAHKRTEGRDFDVVDDKCEVVFLFANSNPRATGLLKELTSSEFTALVAKLGDYCDVRFFIANSAGYGMHEKCMVGLDAYVEFLKR